MGSNFKNVEQERHCILNYLKDMFDRTFDTDVIEAVLLQQNWNVDRAIDDLMTMTMGNTFEIPIEEVEIHNVNPASDQQIQNLGNSEINQNPLLPDQLKSFDDTKSNYDDDGIVILDEEEYVVRTESDDNESVIGENYQPREQLSLRPTPCGQAVSYASVAQKPASANVIRAAKEHTVRTKPPYIIFQGYTSYDRIKRMRDSFERVKLYVQNCFKIMVILRGCPGSGKSTLAKNILKECNVKNNPIMHIHSADNFFYLNECGEYKFDKEALPKAHGWNVANILNIVREGLTPVIVDNTNTQVWEMERYASMAVCAGYEIEVMEPDTPWAFNIGQLVSKNIHKIPREKLIRMVDHYEHHVSATTLLKHFNLKYSPERLPPQNGVRTINDSTLISTFDRIYRRISIARENVPGCTTDTASVVKARKKHDRKKLRKITDEEAAAAAAFVELDDLTETDSANSVNDVENDDVTAGEEEDMDEVKEGSDSDPSWLTMDDDGSTEESCASEEDKQQEVNEVFSVDSDAQSQLIKKNTNSAEEIDVTANHDVQEFFYGENTQINEKFEDLIPVVIDKLPNPLNIVDGSESIALSPNVIDAEASGSRLKCFEKLRDDGKKEEGLECCMDQVLNNVLGIIKDAEIREDPVVHTEFTNQMLNNVEMSDLTEAGLEHNQFSNNSSVTSESASKFTDCLSGSELVVSKSSDNNSNFNTSSTTAETPSPVEVYVDCFSKLANKPVATKSVHNLSDPEISPNKGDRTPDVTDNICNTRDRKLKLCNIEGQKNTSLDVLNDAPCSYKFKDDSTKNVIANDLWGNVNENEIDAENNASVGEEKELSDDNSDNVESRSNSSSSDEIGIMDVHNTSNRFVNNDIKNEQNERKKPDINRRGKNQNVADDVVENIWNTTESVVPELNTLKERILINSFDKVFNQNQNIEFPVESTGAFSTTIAADVKQTKLPQCRSSVTTSFQIIENKLKDECCREECSTSSSRSEDFEDAIDSSESRLLNQWMRGENWDEVPLDVPEMKKNESDIKPQRMALDSPSKQKNRETASNIRLINDIRNVSDSSKMCLLLDKKNKNQDSASQPLKSTNFQSQFWLDQSSPHSLNTMQRVSSKEDDIESDFEAKLKNYRTSDDHSFEPQRNNVFCRSYPSPFKNFDANDSQFWPGISDSSNAIWGITASESSRYSQMNNKGSPELLDSLIARHRNIVSDDNSSDFEKSILKWSPFNDTGKNKTGETITTSQAVNSYFVPVEIMNQERNKATNTGLDESASAAIIKIGRCREINQGRSSPERSIIESSYKCDKSTMADVSGYTMKAKPLKEDLVNIFPLELVDVILDLYDKCNGNMDWIIEILMEDGYSPSDDQLEYLSSLQNMVGYEMLVEENSTKEKVEKDKKVSDKKKNKAKNSKNGRGGSNLQNGKKMEACSSATDFNDQNSGEGTNLAQEEHVDLFFDWCTVSQLLEYFGNPTIYSIGDYQPTVTLPISLARQLHAYLIGNIIDQAEENEDLINQMSEEDSSINSYIQNSNVEELSQKDLTDVENSLSDFLQEPSIDLSGGCSNEGVEGSIVNIVRHKDSFASKLSLNLLLKAFPTLDSSFVKSTFKSQNFNYYDTKNVLNQYGKEVPIDAPRDSPLNEHDSFENDGDDDIQFFGNNSNVTNTRSETLQQVTEYRKNASGNLHQWQKCHESLRTAVREKKFGVAAYYRDIMNVFKQKYEENNAHAAAALINSCCLQNSDMIDLHFFKVTEALKALDKFLDEHLRRLLFSGRSRMTLYIITGRGTRSVNGVSRIQPSVKNRLKRRNISCEVESHNIGLVKAIIRRNSLMSNSL